MGFFDGFDSADPSGNTPRFPANCVAIARVHQCRIHQGQWGLRYIVEADILQSDSPEAPEGARMSWTVKIDGPYAKMGLGEVKSFAAACKGIQPANTAAVNATINSGFIETSLVDKGNSLAGCIVKTQTTEKTAKSGNEIVKHVWMPVDPAEAAMLAAGAPPMSAPAPMPASVPSAPGLVATFPPSGWTAHHDAPGYFYRGQEVLSEAELRATMAPAPVAAPAAPPMPPAGPPMPPAIAAPLPPQMPPAIAAPLPPPAPVVNVWPPAGWTAHPDAAGYFFKGQEVKDEASLRAAASQGLA